jgi:alanine racemase
VISPRHGLDKLLAKFENEFDTLNRIEVSRSAILHNFDHFKTDGRDIIPVLKSNAYGHGIEQVAEILRARKFPYIAVDGYFEALRIRSVSSQPVLVMGNIKPSNYQKIKIDNFSFVVHDIPTIRLLGSLGKSIKVHLEINTGMNRYGIDPAELDGFLAELRSFPTLELEGVMSHLADADGETDTYTQSQIELFDATVEKILEQGISPRYIHLAQTAGSTHSPSRYANAMRLGIGLYGINPLTQANSRHAKLRVLKPALTLKSTITKIIQLKKGDKVSYNGEFTAPAAMPMGVLALGYYEGVPRVFSNAGFVKYGSQMLPIIGRVCMNHCMVDLRGSKAQVGDEVTILSAISGDPNAVQAVCDIFNLSNYELTTRLSLDVRRVIVD